MADLLRRAGKAFASANRSTFAALIGGAVVSASGAVLGSVLDAMYAGIEAGPSLDSTIDAVDNIVTESTGWTSARGRAAWLRERSVGRQDPGMTAYLLFLQELSVVRRS